MTDILSNQIQLFKSVFNGRDAAVAILIVAKKRRKKTCKSATNIYGLNAASLFAKVRFNPVLN